MTSKQFHWFRGALALNSRYGFTQACGADNTCTMGFPARCSCRLHPSPSDSDVSRSHASRRNVCPPKSTKPTRNAVSARTAARQVATGAGHVQPLGTRSCPPACTRSNPREPSELLPYQERPFHPRPATCRPPASSTTASEGHGGSLAGRLRAGREALAASRCDGFAAPPTKSGKPCQICEIRRWDEREETIFNKVPKKRTMTNDECGIRCGYCLLV